MIGLAIIIALIVLSADALIEYQRKPVSKKGVYLANKVAEYKQEEARNEQKVYSDRIKCVEWNVKSREVESIEFEEVY